MSMMIAIYPLKWYSDTERDDRFPTWHGADALSTGRTWCGEPFGPDAPSRQPWDPEAVGLEPLAFDNVCDTCQELHAQGAENRDHHA